MLRHQKSNTFELVFTPKFPAFFILGALALAVAGGSLYDLLKKLLGDTAPSLLLILALSAALIFILVCWAYYAGALQKRPASKQEVAVPEGIAGKPNPPQRKGLIALVSKPEPVKKAIEYHFDKLERVWLIATKQTEDLAYEIKGEYDGSGIKFEVVSLANEFDLEKAQAVVEGIYNTRLDGMAEEDVTADFTGGTKLMTVGMIFGCLSPSRKLQYIPADYTGNTPKPFEPIEYTVNAPGVEALKGEASERERLQA